jgi:hypothetical protein
VSRWWAWVGAGAVLAVALGIRAVAAAQVAFPIPEDTAYYAGVARNLVEGRGLVSDALWSYQTPPLTLPRAAFEVWLPLPSLLAAIPMAIVGVGHWFRAAQAVSVASGAILVVLAWRVGADVAAELALPPGRARTLAVGTGLVAAVLGPLVVYSALPDSTGLFAVVSVAACLLMTRIAAKLGAADGGGGVSAVPLIALGLLLGLAALTRGEAAWLGLAWFLLLWKGLPRPSGARTAAPAEMATSTRRMGATDTGAATAGSPATGPATATGDRRPRLLASFRGPGPRLRAALIPTAVAGLVFAPWAIRNLLIFGTALPGQAIGNALYATGLDMYAYQDPPSLASYLAQGPIAIAGQHLAGIVHDLVNVLVIPAFPLGLIGLIALPRVWRLDSLRPLVLLALLTFGITSLAFPVATQSGTYLHAAGPAFILLAVGCMAGLDSLVAAVGRVRGWTRPVAWLGPAFAIATLVPLTVVSVAAVSGEARDVDSDYELLTVVMEQAGVPLADVGPVITDFPVWLAESQRVPALALPEEAPASVLDLARRFGSHLLVIRTGDDRAWPAILGTDAEYGRCFQEVPLAGASVNDSGPLSAGRFRVYRIVCP